MYDQGSTSRGTFHNLQDTRLSTAPDSYDADPNQHATHQPPESLESLEAGALEVLGQRKRRKRIRFSSRSVIVESISVTATFHALNASSAV